jgi:DNA ligase (NAD+)
METQSLNQNNNTTRAQELESLIRDYSASYYNGEAEISDKEFDALWDELKKIDPNNAVLKEVGADDTDGFTKAEHIIPMGSQDKAANPAEFLAWAKKINPDVYVVQYKLDGASLELQYVDGILAKAVTRGKGKVGDDITANAKRMNGVVSTLDIPFSGGIRGEVIMTHEVWGEKYRDKANCRNAANGIMRRKDGEGCEDLHLICYDTSNPNDDDYFRDEVQKIEWLKACGFEAAVTEEFTNPEEIISYREKVSENRKNLSFDIDGLVVKDKTVNMEDLRRARPERQIAFKFELEVAVSMLAAVEWSESGATYTPIGIIDPPVRLAGTTVQRANLNNPAMIRNMALKIGSLVTIVKRGEIIPKIEGLAVDNETNSNEQSEIEMPSVCGTCNTTLIDAGTRLYCPNPDCKKRLLHRLEKWIDVLEIRELGEKLIRQLYEKGRVHHIEDLYTLTVDELAAYERMAETSAAKVIRHIRNPRALSLSAFIAGFDFEGIGETIMDKVAAAGFDTLEKLESASVKDLSEVFGLGEITAKVIVDGIAESKNHIEAVLSHQVISIKLPLSDDEQPLKGKSFCFTGELISIKRNEAEAKVKVLGGAAKSSVTKDLSFLVTNDKDSGSGKNKKANELGIPIINEKEFLAIIDNPSKIDEKKQSKPKGNIVQGDLFG